MRREDEIIRRRHALAKATSWALRSVRQGVIPFGTNAMGHAMSQAPHSRRAKWPKRKRRNQPVTYTQLLISNCSSAFKGKNACAKNRQAYEKIRRVVETEGSKTRNRSGLSTMIVNQPPEKLHHAAPSEIDDDFMMLHALAHITVIPSNNHFGRRRSRSFAMGHFRADIL